MVYRDFGNTGVRLSPLGFGMMRLPEDEKTSVEMVRSAIDAGINYIDTAYNYLGGNSEFITARALADGRSVLLSSDRPRRERIDSA